jgi:hypothetical protein
MNVKQKQTKYFDQYKACSIVEGFSDEEHSPEDHILAWASLIKSGACWSLQGFYGRGASNIIESGMVSKEGIINHEQVHQVLHVDQS